MPPAPTSYPPPNARSASDLAMDFINSPNRPSDWQDQFSKAMFQDRHIWETAKIVCAKLASSRLDPNDIQQVIVMSMLGLIDARKTPINDTGHFYAMCYRVGYYSGVNELQVSNAAGSISLEESSEEGGNFYVFNEADSDEGRSQLEAERASDLSSVKRRLQSYRVMQHSSNSDSGNGMTPVDPHYRKSRMSTSPTVLASEAAENDEVRPKTTRPLIGPPSIIGLKDKDQLNSVIASGKPATIDPRFARVKRLKSMSEIIESPRRKGRPPGPSLKSTPKRNEAQQELFELWQKSQLNQSTYATEMGITEDAFKSYIYGRTRTLPEGLLEKANTHAKESASHIKVLEKVALVPMEDIIAGWCKQLGFSVGDDTKVATVVGVDPTTVMRWRKGVSRPTVRDLNRFALKILSFAESSTNANQALAKPMSKKRLKNVQAAEAPAAGKKIAKKATASEAKAPRAGRKTAKATK